MVKVKFTVTLLLLSLLLWLSATAVAQGTAFTYQGKLTDSGNLANGNYDLQFKLFDTATVGTGTQQGSTVTVSNVTVTNGIFTVSLDFGVCPTCFNGAARFLEIAVRPTGGSFTTLTPRQPIASNPYAIRSLNAAAATTADGLSVACVSCVTSSHIGSVNGSVVTGTIPVASVPAGNTNYIQNGASQQASSNFNISGTGSADILNATTQFNLGNSRVLSVAGINNLFAGIGAGTNNTINGSNNAFFGASAGAANNNGFENAFFGSRAGQFNTTGSFNAFFGSLAGNANTTGSQNAFFGRFAGSSNTTGSNNAFFGLQAGNANTTGSNNTFIGKNADFDATNTTGDNNTLLGASSRVTSGSSNATAIGFKAQVEQDNSLVLGSINGTNGATADTRVGIGTTAPTARFDVVDTSGTSPVRFGNSTNDSGGYLTSITASQAILSGGAKFDGTNWVAKSTSASRLDMQSGTIRFTTDAGLTAGSSFTPTEQMRITGTGLVGIGTASPTRHLHILGTGDQELAIESSDAGGRQWTLQSSQGSNSGRFEIIDRTAGQSRMSIISTGNVGIGTVGPLDKLHVNGILRVQTLGAADTTTTLCRNSSNQIATCNSSSLRYKTAVQPFVSGLEIVNRLRPITFTWKQSGIHDLGFAAEEVAKVEPLFTFTNEKGEVEGVKYDRLSVVLVNAVKELKQENDQLKQQLSEQQQEMAVIKNLLCQSQPHADLCKTKSLK